MTSQKQPEQDAKPSPFSPEDENAVKNPPDEKREVLKEEC